MNLRDQILTMVQGIDPYDEQESRHISNTLHWVQSGADLFRIQKPDIPPKHLVSYFVVIDTDKQKVLLIDHINAGLWLPPGGHVELNEHPKTTVEREIVEELNMKPVFISEVPFFLTQAVTVNIHAGHTDVSLWFVLKGDSDLPIVYDANEFNGYRWFGYDQLLQTPISKLDPHLHRFMKKWLKTQS